MKKIFYSICILCGLMSASCTNDNDEGQSGTTRLMVDLSTDVSFSDKGSVKRAIDESAYKDIKNYVVTLTETATGTPVHTGLYADWALAYEVTPGTQYTLTATYGEEAAASFDQLLVSGSETFTPQEGATKVVKFMCRPKAAKVNVVYDPDFHTFYSDCEVSIKTKHMDQPLTLRAENEGQDLFLQADEEGEDVDLTFTVKDLQGRPVEVDGMTAQKTVTVKPQTLLRLTFKPDVTEIEGGKFGVNISVNTDLTEEEVNIVIPNTVFE